MLQTWQVESQKQKVPCVDAGGLRLPVAWLFSRSQIIHECSDWNVSDRQIETYIAKARQLLEEDCNVARPAYLAELLQRLRTYEIAAAKRGQYQVAVNSATQQAKLIGLDT